MASFLPYCSAQVATGVLRFNSYAGGPFDTVNLGNLNVHFTVPVLHKAGRGMSFAYDLNYDSSIYEPVVSNGTTSWQPSSKVGSYGSYWGWQKLALYTPYVNYTTAQTSSGTCYNNQHWYVLSYTNYLYYDAFGTGHPFPGVGGSQMFSPGGSGCPPPSTSTQGTGTASDGSGYSISFAVVGSSNGNVSTSGGTTSSVPFLTSPPSGTSPYSATDNNGNKITFTSGTFTDTLGTTVLTITGAQPNPVKFSYIPPINESSGTRVSVTVTFKNYTVQTNFNAKDSNNHAIAEYKSTTAVALVDNITLPDGTKYQFQYEATPSVPSTGACTPLSGTTCTTGRIASVTVPEGGTITYTYSGGSNGIYSDGSTSGLDRILAASTTCNSSNGCWQYSRSLVSGTPGPGSTWQTIVVDPNSNYTVLNFAEDGTTNTSTTQATYAFYQTERQAYQGSVSTSNLLDTIIECYNGNYTSCSTASVKSPITQTDSYSQLPISGNTRLSESQYNGSFAGSGLVSDDKEYDYGVSMGSAPGTANLIRETATTYASLGNGIIARPATVAVYDWTSGSSKTVASATYTYDGSTPTSPPGTTPQHISITGSRGNLTTIASQANSSTTLYRKFTYYDTGNLKSATDAGTASSGGSNITTYNYPDATSTCGNAFATSATLPILGTTPSSTYDCIGGVATQTKDLNGNATTITYNDSYFWRPASVSYPDGGQDSYSYGTNPMMVTRTSKITSSSNFTAQINYDGFGRLSKKFVTSDPTGTDEVDTNYDNMGRVASVSNPYRSTNDPTYGLTQYTYDALSRIIKVTNPDQSTVQTTYTGRAVQLQNEAGRTRVSQMDGLGRLVSVCEVTSVSQMGTSPSACGQDIAQTGFLTSYSYDVLGMLLGVTQGSETRSYTYDEISRLTSESNPESGSTTYTYDSCSAGDLCSRTSPAPNQTGSGTVIASYTYDALHRNTGVTYNDGTTPSGQFLYDTTSTWACCTQTNILGQLSRAQVISGSQVIAGEIFSYDSMGRILLNNQCTPSNCGSGSFGVNYTYDLLGDATSASNGMGVTFGLNYNGAAQLTSYTSSLVDSNHPATLLSGVQYNALGEPISDNLGNGMADSWAYDTLGRVNSYSSSHGSTYYGFGNGMTWVGSELRSAGDAVNGNWNFSYDDFGRLSTASCINANCGNTAFSYAYDRYGNRWQQNVTAGSGPQPQFSFDSHNHMVGFSYDSAGNLLSDGSHSYAYDAENRLIKVDGGATATYVYDALGRRVQSSGENWIYDLWGNRVTGVNNSGGWDVGEVYAGSSHLATYVNGTTYFPLTDWLGTTRMITDLSAANVEQCLNLPFGDGRNCTGSAYHPIQFTGLINDSETSLDHTLFRQYGSTQGRWISPDPAGLGAVDSSNPQSWNRYAYALNNPLALVDPLGLDPCDTLSGGWECYDPSQPSPGVGASQNPDLAGTTGSAGECASGTACYAQIFNSHLLQVFYPDQPYIFPDGPYDNDPFYCYTEGEGGELHCIFFQGKAPEGYSTNTGAGKQVSQLFDKLNTCSAASLMLQDLMQLQAAGKLKVADLGPNSGGTSYFGTITINSNDINAHSFGHEWWHTVQMDTFIRGNDGGWFSWTGAYIVNGWYGVFKGTNFGPLDNEAEAVGQWISRKCGVD